MKIGELLCILIHKHYPELTPKEAYLKAKRWMIFPYIPFGNCTPLELIYSGRSHKVMKYLQAVHEGEI